MIGWGIVGTGHIASWFAEHAFEEGASPLGVCGTSYKKAQVFKAAHGLPKAYESMDAMLADPEIDAVYIAAPNSVHYETARAALLAGKHVFCEKTLVPSVRELDSLTALADEKGLVLTEAMTVFHMPLYPAFKKALPESGLGKLHMMQITFCSSLPKEDGNRFYAKDLGGGVMLDLGTYALSLADTFTRLDGARLCPCVSVSHTGVDKEVGLNLLTKDGVLVSILVAIDTALPRTALLGFENGTALFEGFSRSEEALLSFRETGEKKTFRAGRTDDAFRYERKAAEKMITFRREKGAASPEELRCRAATRRVIGIIEEVLAALPEEAGGPSEE